MKESPSRPPTLLTLTYPTSFTACLLFALRNILRFSVAFPAPDRATVDAFHAAALAAGGRDNGAPGVREQYHPTYYGAFVLDADGNNVEAVCHTPV
jgi:catechol 2,3-dioxygenase-like lactoylglutathione lyase family enzyme